MMKTKFLFLLLAGLLIFSALTTAAPLQNFMIVYTFKNPDGSGFRIIKYYLQDSQKFRTEYYTTVEYNISGSAEGQVKDSIISSEAHAEMTSKSKTDIEPHTIEILRKDKGLVWSMAPDFKDYIEVPLRQDSWEHVLTNIFLDNLSDFKKSGEMKLLNYHCGIYKRVDKVKDDEWTNIFYIAQDLNVILKSELLQNGKLVQTMEAAEFHLEKPADSLFEVPSGYKKNESN